jgi:hydroxymethylglutaryl-CoA lyase
MPPEVKADYLRVLVASGFRHIDAVSFVAKTAVPQMADAELVLEYLDPPDDTEIIGIVVNEKGAERAVETGAVATLGFPYSISPGFLKRNQNQTPEESLEALEAVGTLAYKAGLDVVAYVSMAFGNPYGETWDIEEVVAACDLLVDSGVTQISLADTVGLATPKMLGDVLADVLAVPTVRRGDRRIGWVPVRAGCAGGEPADGGVAAGAEGAGCGAAGYAAAGRIDRGGEGD